MEKEVLNQSNSLPVVAVDHKEYGVSETIANDVKAQFQPMLDKMAELENEYNEVVKLDPENPETAKKAKELRNKFVKIRTGTEKIHKEQKDFYLKAGRFIDGWKNAQIFASSGKEKKLLEIENYLEEKEYQRKLRLHEQRLALISPYLIQGADPEMNYSDMPSEVFDAFLERKKKTFQEYKQAEADALERQQKEQQRLENLQIIKRQRIKELMPYNAYINDFDAAISLETDEEFQSVLKSAKEQFENDKAEKEKISKRRDQLMPYAQFIENIDSVLKMDDETFNNVLKSAIKSQEQFKKIQVRRRTIMPFAYLFEDVESIISLKSDAEFDKQIAAAQKKKEEQEAEKERLKKIEEENIRKEQEKKAEDERLKKENRKIKRMADDDKLKHWVSQFSLPDPLVENNVSKEIQTKFKLFKHWAVALIFNQAPEE